jgi:hypothetical protein
MAPRLEAVRRPPGVRVDELAHVSELAAMV